MLDKIGRYEVIEFIGGGGAGDVYKALDPNVEREVAVKLLTATSSDQRERFKREQKLLAALNHPNIVPVYDAAEHEGRPFIVMPLISNGTLHDLLQTTRLSYSKILHYFTKLASALDFAHQRGIVHRDIKPANILFNDQDEPMIADFGLSKIFTSDSGPSPTLDQIIGTPHYMSPEQSRGKKLDHRSDIYSMGVILFEICNARVPFDADEPMGILFKHVNDDVPPMPHLPKAVAQVIKRAMEKDPTKRYQSATELVNHFGRAVNSLMGEIPPPNTGLISKTGAIIRERPWLPYAGLGAIAFIAIFILFLVSRSPEEMVTISSTAVPNPTSVETEIAVNPTDPPPTEETITLAPTSTVSGNDSGQTEPSDNSQISNITPPTDTPEATSTTAAPETGPLFIITRRVADIYTGPDPDAFNQLDADVREGDELALIAFSDTRTWVLVELSTGVRGWVSALAGRIEGAETAEVVIAATVPAAPTPIPLTPTATNTLEPTATAAVSTLPPPPPTINPLDLDQDGVLHDPDNGFFDLCQDAPGNPGTCGCPSDQVPSSCGGSGGDDNGRLP